MSNFLIDEDTDLLAAEFVLGTLDSDERANAQSLLRMDHGFIAMVRIWERRFGELHLMVEPVDPDAKIFERVKAKIAELAASAPAPDGKPAAAAIPAVGETPPPQPADATGPPPEAEPPKPEPPKAETLKPAETSPSGELPKPPDVAATAATLPVVVPVDGTVPKAEDAPPSEASPKSESEKPPETAPASAPAAVVPGPIIPTAVVPPAVEVAVAVPTEPEPVAKVGIPGPPTLAPAALKLPDKASETGSDRPARRPEITIDVVRSRGRWRMLGICMTLLAVGWVALLAAWRFVPDRLPARLRPAELMTSIGIQALPPPATTVKPPPESQFDE